MSFNNNLNSTLGNTNIKNNSNYNLNSSNLNHSFNNSNNFPSGNINNTNLTNQDNKNLNNEIISKSIVYGSIAFWLGKKSEQNLTHKWCVYVRGINNEDLSYFIKEVVFTLHSTFENNVRTFKKWPYELYSSGWGEFDIKITIHFIDETIKPIDFVHFLKLYPPANQAPSTKKPIVSEFFDEIVFVNPKKQLRESLINSNNLIKNDSSIQIPINDEDKKSMDFSVFTIDDQMKEKNFSQQNNIENKLENLSITNHNQGNNNLEENNDDMEVEGDEFNQSNNQQGMNQLNFNQNLNNDSMSVFSNNINEQIDKKIEDRAKTNSNFIPNISQYFLNIDDSPHLRILEDANNFVTKEIQKLRKELELKDRDIVSLKRSLREHASKTNV